MTTVTLKHVRKVGPTKGIRHRLVESECNFWTAYHALDGFTCDIGIITRAASQALANAQGKDIGKDINVRTVLDSLYDLERQVKQAVELLEIHMAEVSFIEETVPEEIQEEACV